MIVNSALIIREGDTVSIPLAVESLRETALANCALVGIIKDADTKDVAVEALREVKTLLSNIEKARVKTKQPVLDIGREIDALAKKFTEELRAEDLRIDALIGNYDQEKREIARRAEVERQEELRKIEEDRQRAIDESLRLAREEEEKRQAELRRIAQEESAAKSKADKDHIAAERAAIEKQRQESEAKRLAEEKANSERAAQAVEAVGGPVIPVTTKGQTSKDAYDYEVKDIWLLARMHPALVKIEPNRSEILAMLNNHGVKEIKGLKIVSVVKNRVQTKLGALLIEV